MTNTDHSLDSGRNGVNRSMLTALAGTVLAFGVGGYSAKSEAAEPVAWDAVTTSPIPADGSLQYSPTMDEGGNWYFLGDSGWDGEGSLYFYDGASAQQITFPSTELSSHEDTITSVQYSNDGVDDDCDGVADDSYLYLHASGDFRMSGTGTSLSIDTNLNDSGEVNASYGFTNDYYSDDYLQVREYALRSVDAVFDDATSGIPILEDDPNHLFLPSAVGNTGLVLMTQVDPSWSTYVPYYYDQVSGDHGALSVFGEGYYGVTSASYNYQSGELTACATDLSDGGIDCMTGTFTGEILDPSSCDTDTGGDTGVLPDDTAGDTGTPPDTDTDTGTPPLPVDADGDGSVEGVDCDDANAAVHPGAAETCNDTDDDCDGVTDEDATDVREWHQDSDGDLYGSSVTVEACDAPDGFVADDMDCDDTNALINPGAIEVCDGFDNDCVDGIDNGAADMSTWYSDTDGDNYGDASSSQLSCEQPAMTVSNGYDCDDSDASINPSAEEVWENSGIEVDNDCDYDTEDYAIVTATGDCNMETTALSMPLQYMALTGENCVLTLVNAEGSVDYDGTPSTYALDPGSSVGVYWTSGNNPNYTLVLEDVSSGTLDSHDTAIPIFKTSASAPAYVFATDGCVQTDRVEPDGDGVKYTGSVLEVGGKLFQNPDPEGDPTLENIDSLIPLADLAAGDSFTATVTSEGDTVTTTIDGVTETIVDTTHADTGPEETDAKPDTGTDPQPPEGGCEGCAMAGAPNVPIGRVMTAIGALLTLAGIRRRKENN